MKKVVLIPVWNRPDYTAQVLERVVQAPGYDLVLSCELGAPVELYRTLAPGATILTTEAKLGFNPNVRKLCDYAMKAEYEFMVYLEDDCVPSPGWWKLADFYASNIPFLDSFVCGALWSQSIDQRWPELVVLRGGRAWPGKGWCMTRNQCEVLWKFFDQCKTTDTCDTVFMRFNWYHPYGYLAPALSRIHNIGREGGAFTPPWMHDQFHARYVADESGLTEKFVVLHH